MNTRSIVLARCNRQAGSIAWAAGTTVHDETERQTRREQVSTPAMRMFLPKAPVRLDIILNTDWRKKLNSARAALKRTESRSKKGRSIISRNRAELGKVGLQISKPSPR
jgi:hypothetical protein